MVETSGPYSDEEIQAFAGKLETWAKSLPEREQRLLAVVIGAAETTDADVSGFMWSSIFSGTLTSALPITERVRGGRLAFS